MNIFGWNIGGFGNSRMQVERDKSGNWSYMMPLTAFGGENKQFLEWSLCNPVLFAVCAAKAKLYSQMQITAVNTQTEEEVKDLPELNLISQPNYFQSKQDFLYQQSWFLSATGNNLIYQIRPFASELPRALYNLIPDTVDYKETLKVKKFLSSKSDITDFEKQLITYRLDNQEYKLLLRDIIPLYDVSSGLECNTLMKSPSRVKAIVRNLLNIEENLKAENINLQMSQKYRAINKTNRNGMAGQIHDGDRKLIEQQLFGKSLQITNGDIDVQHLVSDLKKLYLNENFAHNANVVVNAFEMNRDVLNYALTGSTFENQEHGIIRFIQSAVQSDADNTMNSLTNSWGLPERNIKLKASYNHLPIMQTLVNSKLQTLASLSSMLVANKEAGLITDQEAKDQYKKTKKELGL